MTTARWIAELPARRVQLDTLQPIQASGGGGGSRDPIMHVVEIDGRRFIEDGHGRYFDALAAGRSWMLARVLVCEQLSLDDDAGRARL
jgi:hypothetical protein